MGKRDGLVVFAVTAPQDPYSGYGGLAGYYTDWETGLSLLGFRYYDVASGRFLTRDPIGYAGGINLYAYVGNCPLGRQDSSGLFPFPQIRFIHKPIEWGANIGGAIGGCLGSLFIDWLPLPGVRSAACHALSDCLVGTACAIGAGAFEITNPWAILLFGCLMSVVCSNISDMVDCLCERWEGIGYISCVLGGCFKSTVPGGWCNDIIGCITGGIGGIAQVPFMPSEGAKPEAAMQPTPGQVGTGIGLIDMLLGLLGGMFGKLCPGGASG